MIYLPDMHRYSVIQVSAIILIILAIPTRFPELYTKTSHIGHPPAFQLTTRNEVTLTVLVVLMELPDDLHDPTHTVNYYNQLFFGDGAFSIRQYYRNTSYGEINLGGKVLGWYTAAKSLSYYGAGNRIPPEQDTLPDELAYEAALKATNDGINVREYDLFVVIHSGDGQEYSGGSDDIWSHKWSLWQFEGWENVEYSMNHEYVNYETPSHELGHALNFPDLYDWKYNANEFVGPYGMMAGGSGHFSIWNKYYSHVSFDESPQFLDKSYRLQITNHPTDTFAIINPLGLKSPQGIMWLEVGWNSSEFNDVNYGHGWTITNRENLDYDQFIPTHGIIISDISVYPRPGFQVSDPYYPVSEVIDAHPETAENKDDAAFNLELGGIGGYSSSKIGGNWAVQILEKYSNLSYHVRVTNASNIPEVSLIEPQRSLSNFSTLWAQVNGTPGRSISSVEFSINNGPWFPSNDSGQGMFSYQWNTSQEREGSHLIRARALDDATIPYIGYSEYIFVAVDNRKGTILVVDDDLGRTSEIPILEALDSLGLRGEYEVVQSSSLISSTVSAIDLQEYEVVLWIGNPAITPLSSSHINYQEFTEIRDYLTQSPSDTLPRIMVMSSYTLFDFSNQDSTYHSNFTSIFQASSPKNFRAPTTLLEGQNFLANLPFFELGANDTLLATRRSDGELADLFFGTTPILIDVDPEFPKYEVKGYYVDSGIYKLVNYMFQPEMVPKSILPDLLNKTLFFFSLPNNSSFVTKPTSIFLPLDVGAVILILGIGIFGSLATYFGIFRKRK